VIGQHRSCQHGCDLARYQLSRNKLSRSTLPRCGSGTPGPRRCRARDLAGGDGEADGAAP